MATKWKNIIKAFFLRIRGNKRLFLGLILECAGAAFLFWIYWRVFYYGAVSYTHLIEASLTVIQGFVMTAIELMTNPAHLEAIKDEFKKMQNN